MRLQESGEMYLESIYILSKEKASVRSIDIAEHLGYSKPSVSRAVSILKTAGYVTVDQNGYLHLTEQGKISAKKTYERHEVLTKFFNKLGVDTQVASDDACKIEHVISDETFNKIKEHLIKLN